MDKWVMPLFSLVLIALGSIFIGLAVGGQVGVGVFCIADGLNTSILNTYFQRNGK